MGRAPNNIAASDMQKLIMKRHVGRFVALPPERKAELQARADIASVAKAIAATELASARQSLELHVSRQVAEVGAD